MNARKQRANSMMETHGYCSQVNSNDFQVRSQTDPSKFYIVSKTDNGLKCECKDHEIRKSDCKHIKIVLEIIKNNKRYRNNEFRIMERLNGEIRDREKVFRGLKKKDTPLIAGLKLWYNFSKEHGGLGGDVTPSEAALIKVDGDNKWKTIIQNASLNRDYE